MFLKDELNHIFPNDFQNILLQKEIIIIDIREPYELLQLPYKRGINIPMNELINNYESYLKKDKTYYILCHHGQRSYLVTEFLHRKGFDVINVVGGVDLVNRFDSSKI